MFICIVMKLFILTNTLFLVRADRVKYNESWPPLYALEDWSSCQRPGDVYCNVDAVLLGSEELLQQLYDYSNETLKHYDRRLIHRGVCVSRCGDPVNRMTSAQSCVNQSVLQYSLEAEVTSADWCTTTDAQTNKEQARALAIPCIILLVVVFLATGLHIFGDKYGKIKGNKYLLAFSLKRNWEILTYDRAKPRTDQRMKDITSIEGIRFLGMQSVIFSHVLFIYMYSYIDNPQFIENMYDHFAWQSVLNSPLWLQAFFSMSGFLTAYTVLISSTVLRPYTWLKCVMGIINRWIRLTPLSVFALWFTIAWFPVLGSGPQWAWVVGRESLDCSDRWWYHMLYVHNHLPLGKLCMGHTWYLAVDMQLHVIGLLILLVTARHPRSLMPVLSVLLVGSAITAGLVVYFYQLTPIITAQSPEALRTMFADSKILPLLYLPSWMNLPGYLCGTTTAYVLHQTQILEIKMNKKKWFTIMFDLSLLCGGAVVFSGTVFLRYTTLPVWAAAVYSAIDRTLVSVAFSVFMLGCFVKCESKFRELLEWRGFHLLGRLSYCAYLIHFIVLRLTLATNTQLGHASVLSMMCLLITTSVLTYVISIPLCLLIELPPIQLWKALTDAERFEEQCVAPTVSPSRPPLVKPFDLINHINRRQNVH